MRSEEQEKKYEVVGNIRIKEPKKKNKDKKKKDKDSMSLGWKIFVWFMFIAMSASFIVPLVLYFINAIK